MKFNVCFINRRTKNCQNKAICFLWYPVVSVVLVVLTSFSIDGQLVSTIAIANRTDAVRNRLSIPIVRQTAEKKRHEKLLKEHEICFSKILLKSLSGTSEFRAAISPMKTILESSCSTLAPESED